LGPHVKPAQGVVFSRDGRKVITADSEGTLTVWDSASGKLLSRVDAHKTLTPALAISPRADAPLIATGGSDGRLRLWDLSLTAVVDLAGSADPALQPKPDKDHADRSGYEEGSEGLPVLGISSATFSLDGALLASASLEDGVSVWDVKSRARLANFGSGHDRTLGLAFTADGKRVFSGGLDGAVVLHDFAGEVLWRNRAHDSRVRVIATSPDGQWMASGGQDNSVVLYAMGPIEKAAVPGHESEDPDAEVREVAADPAEVSGSRATSGRSRASPSRPTPRCSPRPAATASWCCGTSPRAARWRASTPTSGPPTGSAGLPTAPCSRPRSRTRWCRCGRCPSGGGCARSAGTPTPCARWPSRRAAGCSSRRASTAPSAPGTATRASRCAA
jgi:WD40 repeat protein